MLRIHVARLMPTDLEKTSVEFRDVLLQEISVFASNGPFRVWLATVKGIAVPSILRYRDVAGTASFEEFFEAVEAVCFSRQTEGETNDRDWRRALHVSGRDQ